MTVRNLGKAGVGADGDATDASMSSTSFMSMLSTLLSAVRMIGVGLVMVDGVREEDGVEFFDRLRIETFANGESGWPGAGIGMLVRSGLGAFGSLRRMVLARLAIRRTIVGVDGTLLGARDELLDDAEDGGRVMVGAAGFVALVCLPRVGDGTRVGDAVLEAAAAFGVFFSGVEGVTLIAAVRFT